MKAIRTGKRRTTETIENEREKHTHTGERRAKKSCYKLTFSVFFIATLLSELVGTMCACVCDTQPHDYTHESERVFAAASLADDQ